MFSKLRKISSKSRSTTPERNSSSTGNSSSNHASTLARVEQQNASARRRHWQPFSRSSTTRATVGVAGSSETCITNRPGDSSFQPAIHLRPLESTANKTDRYNLRDQKGYVLIFHNKDFKNPEDERKGSEKDLQQLKRFFANYHVKTPDICENFTVKRIKDKMKKIAKKDFSQYSCLLVFTMSHGETRDRILAYDGLYNYEDEVVERVLMNTTLKDKPKLFFTQACKGHARMEYDSSPQTTTNKTDMLKCFSTYEGTVSLRSRETGTYFIQTLLPLIDEHGDKDITEQMMCMRKRFKKDRIPQVPTETSTLTKRFYFDDLKLCEPNK